MITVYSKPNCPYCESAKNWLQNHKFEYNVVDVTLNPDALEFIKGKGHKTVPQLYVGETLIVKGGFTGMQDLGPENLRRLLVVNT